MAEVAQQDVRTYGNPRSRPHHGREILAADPRASSASITICACGPIYAGGVRRCAELHQDD
jgi:hypothetical protein